MKNFLLILVMLTTIFIVSGCGSDTHEDEPWRDLGVSKSEYMEVYNYYR